MTAATFAAAPPSALLDLAESASRARPLRRWQGAQKEAVRERFSAMHREWCTAWIPARDASSHVAEVQVVESESIEVLASHDVACWSFAAKRSAPLPRAKSASLEVAASDAVTSKAEGFAMSGIGRQMFASDWGAFGTEKKESPPIATAVVRAAWTDWLERIGALLNGFPVEPQQASGAPETSSPSDPWSGVLSVRWSWCGGTWTLRLPHDAVAAALFGSGAETTAASTPATATAPRQSLGQALDGQTVSLRILLTGTELSLGQLQDLRLNDVVPLAHALDSPAHVVNTIGSPICEGWLGRRDGRMAIELAASPVASPHVATATRSL
ncbi:FliM/FliN family flagellar motor switch protein [Variovorax sp. OV700]|uniref:FliM/FliN family flagellar motor switch protein n=1 Tax=Variovorax sp. OV700 TaxID=1882826 RepID=UPI00087F4069|nr:FliM/FliN family flagellar motor C-terminal domain-containing protein [Variovorax sp. OV700]SDJ59425.1 Type III flagellar switch regulator (C-ring) FliN C-term [Variovorax sp. OV700]